METNDKTVFIKAGNTRLNLAMLVALRYEECQPHPLSASFGMLPARYVALFLSGDEVYLTEEEGRSAVDALDSAGENRDR